MLQKSWQNAGSATAWHSTPNYSTTIELALIQFSRSRFQSRFHIWAARQQVKKLVVKKWNCAVMPWPSFWNHSYQVNVKQKRLNIGQFTLRRVDLPKVKSVLDSYIGGNFIRSVLSLIKTLEGVQWRHSMADTWESVMRWLKECRHLTEWSKALTLPRGSWGSCHVCVHARLWRPISDWRSHNKRETGLRLANSLRQLLQKLQKV